MPRRSGHHSEESPVPRRTSARIAAANAASPAKSPVKSPRRKRQSNEAKKTEDTELQPSHPKSDGSIEELNGLETGSSNKDRDSVADIQELPSKKAKSEDELNKTDETAASRQSEPTEEPVGVSTVAESSLDFVVVEKTSVPSVELTAVAYQEDDTSKQADKNQTTSATATTKLDLQQITEKSDDVSLENQEEAASAMSTVENLGDTKVVEECTTASDLTNEHLNANSTTVTTSSFNGDSHGSACPDDAAAVALTTTTLAIPSKVCTMTVASIQEPSTPTPTSEDKAADAVNVETVSK